jgi:hypothetical protein
MKESKNSEKNPVTWHFFSTTNAARNVVDSYRDIRCERSTPKQLLSVARNLINTWEFGIWMCDRVVGCGTELLDVWQSCMCDRVGCGTESDVDRVGCVTELDVGQNWMWDRVGCVTESDVGQSRMWDRVGCVTELDVWQSWMCDRDGWVTELDVWQS